MIRHRWHDLLDWWGRNRDLLGFVTVIAALFAVVACCAGTPDDNTGRADVIEQVR